MAENYIGMKLPPEMRAQVIDRANEEGISASEWLRAAISRALDDPTPSVDEGYQQARKLAAQIAAVVIGNAKANLPATYEEFLALYARPSDDEVPDYG